MADTSLNGQTAASPSPMTMATTGTNPSSFELFSSHGALAVFPSEVRSLIWAALILDSDAGEYQPTPSVQPQGLLALSRIKPRLYRETMPNLHWKKILCFAIHPFNSNWAVPGMEGATTIDFRHVDFARFQKIQVNLYAPDWTDPGQLHRLRAQVINLVCMLARLPCAIRDGGRHRLGFSQNLLNHQGEAGWPASPFDYRLQEIEIQFVDREPIVWCDKARPLPALRAVGEGDFARVLGAFHYLRTCLSVNFILPPSDDEEYAADEVRIASELYLIKVSMKSTSSFGSKWYDLYKGMAESEVTVQLDCELDLLNGPTAAILRLQRFQTWKEYEPMVQTLMEAACPYRSLMPYRKYLEQRRKCWLAWQGIGDRTTGIAPMGVQEEEGHRPS